MVKKQIIKNLISAWISKFIKLATAIYMVPLFIGSFGKDAYGIILLLTTILSFSALADLGIRAGVMRNMTKYYAVGDYKNFNKTLNTGLLIYLAIWFILSVLLFVNSEYLILVFKIPAIYQKQCVILLKTYGIITLFWGFTTPLFSAISSSLNRFDIVNYREAIIGTLSIIVLIIAVRFFNVGITGWAVITVLTQLVTAFYILFSTLKLVPQIQVSLKYFDKKMVRSIFSFGGITFVGLWSRKMKIDADPLLISSLLGPASIVYYRSGVAIPSHSRVLLSSFTGQITSVSTSLYAAGDNTRFAAVFERGTKLSLLMSIPFTVIYVVFSNSIINLWLGTRLTTDQILLTSRCFQGMAIVDFCFFLEGSSYAILYAMNRLKFMTYTDLFLGILNIVSSYLLLKYFHWGVWVVIVPTIVIEGIARPFYLYYTARQINYQSNKIIKNIYGPVLLVLSVTSFCAIFFNMVFNLNPLTKIAIGIPIVVIFFLITMWFWGFTKEDKNDALKLLIPKWKALKLVS